MDQHDDGWWWCMVMIDNDGWWLWIMMMNHDDGDYGGGWS